MPGKLRQKRNAGLPALKLVVLGAGGVGKSALTVRFVHGSFIDKYDPTIEDSYQKTIELPLSEENDDNNETEACSLEILDTAGTDQFAAMRELYLKSGDAFLLVYSVCSASTFHDLEAIHQQIMQSASPEASQRILLVGNKADLVADRVISRAQGEELAAKWGVRFIETSARSGANVQEAFIGLPAEIIQSRHKDATANVLTRNRKSCIIS